MSDCELALQAASSLRHVLPGLVRDYLAELPPEADRLFEEGFYGTFPEAVAAHLDGVLALCSRFSSDRRSELTGVSWRAHDEHDHGQHGGWGEKLDDGELSP